MKNIAYSIVTISYLNLLTSVQAERGDEIPSNITLALRERLIESQSMLNPVTFDMQATSAFLVLQLVNTMTQLKHAPKMALNIFKPIKLLFYKNIS